MTIRVTTPGSGGRNGWPSGGNYRRFGDPDWDPAKVAFPPPQRMTVNRLREQSGQRHKRFAELRAEGMPWDEAGAAVGISRKTAWRYEQERKRGEES
jgi:hypothetical protein